MNRIGKLCIDELNSIKLVFERCDDLGIRHTSEVKANSEIFRLPTADYNLLDGVVV